jgi:hypothetical protein
MGNRRVNPFLERSSLSCSSEAQRDRRSKLHGGVCVCMNVVNSNRVGSCPGQ